MAHKQTYTNSDAQTNIRLNPPDCMASVEDCGYIVMQPEATSILSSLVLYTEAGRSILGSVTPGDGLFSGE